MTASIRPVRMFVGALLVCSVVVGAAGQSTHELRQIGVSGSNRAFALSGSPAGDSLSAHRSTDSFSARPDPDRVDEKTDTTLPPSVSQQGGRRIGDSLASRNLADRPKDDLDATRRAGQDQALMRSACELGKAEADLDAGNVKATVTITGSLIKPFAGRTGGYEAPKGSGIAAVDAISMWIGGLVDGEIRMSSGQYRGEEMWPGPLDEGGDIPVDCRAHDRIFEVTKEDVLAYEKTGEVNPGIAEWPWHLGAPVVDGDGDPGNYDLAAGDRPWVHGDQTLWWVMNDAGGQHTLTRTDPIRMEVQATAFAGGDLCGFERAFGRVEPRFRNTLYYRYRLTYRGSTPLEEAWFGLYFLTGLGDYRDDYVGSDSLLGLAYTYNADDNDDEYGRGPPAFGISIVNGPEVVASDGSVDRMGATRFFNDGMWLFRYNRTEDHWNALRGIWRNGVQVTEGGLGMGVTETPVHFMYPGEPGSYWSESVPYPPDWGRRPNVPGYRSSMLSTGPFRMDPGDTQEIDVVLVWSDAGDRLGSVRLLKQDVASIHSAFEAIASYDMTECETPPELPEPSPPTYGLSHYPNPVSEQAVIRYELPRRVVVSIVVYDVLGQRVLTLAEGVQGPGSYEVELTVDRLPADLYLYRIETPGFVGSRALTVVH